MRNTEWSKQELLGEGDALDRAASENLQPVAELIYKLD